ncbi:DNA polymerase III subunit psi [Colwellia sp. MEBiC06753]
MISAQAFDKLSAMGIPLYQQRSKEASPVESFLPVVPAEVANSTLFNDLLLAINVTPSEVTFTDNTIDLGLINWRFVETDTVSLNKNQLLSPSIERISQSVTLKKQLWHLIGNA